MFHITVFKCFVTSSINQFRDVGRYTLPYHEIVKFIAQICSHYFHKSEDNLLNFFDPFSTKNVFVIFPYFFPLNIFWSSSHKNVWIKQSRIWSNRLTYFRWICFSSTCSRGSSSRARCWWRWGERRWQSRCRCRRRTKSSRSRGEPKNCQFSIYRFNFFKLHCLSVF